MALSQSPERLAADRVTLDFDASDAAGIVRLYATLFGRRADEEGLNHWLAHGEEGLSLAGIARPMLAAQEAAPVAAQEDRSFVARLYEVGLQRTGSADELAAWTHLLEAGTLARHDVLLAFAQAPETVALVGSVTTSIETL